MYFARGFAELQLASDFCNGIPLTDGSSDVIVFGTPLPVKDVFAVAVASFDSALAPEHGDRRGLGLGQQRVQDRQGARAARSGLEQRTGGGGARGGHSDHLPL